MIMIKVTSEIFFKNFKVKNLIRKFIQSNGTRPGYQMKTQQMFHSMELVFLVTVKQSPVMAGVCQPIDFTK